MRVAESRFRFRLKPTALRCCNSREGAAHGSPDETLAIRPKQ